MIITAAEADGAQIQDIAARTRLFNKEEVETVEALWEDYLTGGPVVGGRPPDAQLQTTRFAVIVVTGSPVWRCSRCGRSIPSHFEMGWGRVERMISSNCRRSRS